jgi:Holliday junction resolvasome RuvABC ATP-dependent DNA helicase subunit
MSYNEPKAEKPQESNYEGFWNRPIPADLFQDIIGYEDIKQFIIMALQSPDPISIILVGPPASAKSLFLDALESWGGRLVVGSKLTKAGLADILLEERPPLLLFDEIEKVNKPYKELSPLLTWMQDGRVKSDTGKDRLDFKMDIKWMVIAAANRINNLSPELLSRFGSPLRIKDYTRHEFINVTKNVLMRREGIDENLSTHISNMMVFSNDFNVREAIRIARLVKHQEDPLQKVHVVFRIKDKYR